MEGGRGEGYRLSLYRSESSIIRHRPALIPLLQLHTCERVQLRSEDRSGERVEAELYTLRGTLKVCAPLASLDLLQPWSTGTDTTHQTSHVLHNAGLQVLVREMISLGRVAAPADDTATTSNRRNWPVPA